MCKCNHEIRTPFCGKFGCEWPVNTTVAQKQYKKIDIFIREKNQRGDLVFNYVASTTSFKRCKDAKKYYVQLKKLSNFDVKCFFAKE